HERLAAAARTCLRWSAALCRCPRLSAVEAAPGTDLVVELALDLGGAAVFGVAVARDRGAPGRGQHVLGGGVEVTSRPEHGQGGRVREHTLVHAYRLGHEHGAV